jgi:AraC-like DNA-binding protein
MEGTRKGKKNIRIHKLQERTGRGMVIKKISETQIQQAPLDVHRDDHYIFILQKSGSSKMSLEFREVELNGYGVFYMLPAQVHQIHRFQETDGWVLAIDTLIIEEKYRIIFEEVVLQQRPLLPDEARWGRMLQCIEALYSLFEQLEQSYIGPTVIHNLASAYIGLIAEAYLCNEHGSGPVETRPKIITRQFKKCLRLRFKELKSPGAYASELCLSLSYLNEAVKSVTGFTVGYWIQQEVILEAKRLLLYTNLTVKQIAFSIGYEDHAYFSRLFSKATGSSPLKFRLSYHV